MNAKDLMIGDWYAFRGHPYKCTASDIASIAECEEKGAPTDISEIPLTPEILEKNGMILSLYGEFFLEDEHYEFEISVVGGRIFWTINAHEYDIMCLRFVHELQHALRLCGIEKEIVL